MAITDAQFAAFLVNDGIEKVILSELDYMIEEGGAPSGQELPKLRWASHGKVTGYDDSPPHTLYESRLRSIPAMPRSLDLDTLTGSVDVIVGDVVLDNADGGLDQYLGYNIDGRAIKFYIGAKEWRRVDYREIVHARALRFEAPDELTIVLKVSDASAILDTDISGTQFASGESAGKLKPLIYGSVLNHAPMLDDAVTLKYLVLENYKAATVVPDVRDNGTSLQSGQLWSATNATLTANAGTETMSFTSHGLSENDVVTLSGSAIFAGLSLGTQYWIIAGGLTPNDFRVSLTKAGSAVNITGTSFAGTVALSRARYYDNSAVDGSVLLASKPDGLVTCDVKRDGDNGFLPFATIREMIAAYQGEASLDSLSVFTAADAARTARVVNDIYCGIVISGRVNLLQLTQRLAADSLGWLAQKRDGTLTVGLLNPVGLSAELHTRTLKATDVLGGLALVNLPIRHGLPYLLHDRNQVVQQSGLSTGLTVYEQARFDKQFRFEDGDVTAGGSSYAEKWWLYHATALRKELELPTVVWFSGGSPQTHVEAHANDAKPWHQVLSFDTDLQTYDWEIGEVALFEYPRYGMASGKNCRVIGVEPDLLKCRVKLTLFTATYYG